MVGDRPLNRLSLTCCCTAKTLHRVLFPEGILGEFKNSQLYGRRKFFFESQLLYEGDIDGESGSRIFYQALSAPYF